MTSNLPILLRDRRKEDFIGVISKMARNTKSSGHKIYFMILCSMGVEVFQEGKIDKYTRCVEDCEYWYIYGSEYDDYYYEKKPIHKPGVRRNLYQESLCSSTNSGKKQHRT